MNSEIFRFVGLRVYKNMTTLNILNSMICNRIMKIPFIVRNSRTMYELSSKILTKTFVNAVVKSTFCKTLTAGNTIAEANTISDYFRKENIPVILDYCAQGEVHNSNSLIEAVQDANATMFAQSAQTLKDRQNEMISIKITGLINMETLKNLNESVLMRDKFWEENSVEGKMNAETLFNSLQKIYLGLSEQQFQNYLNKIHGYQGPMQDFVMDETDFKMKHHPFYLYDETKNENFVIKLFSPLTKGQQQQCYNFARRINEILEPQSKNQNNFRILVDAEQSYTQYAIEAFSEQMQQKYNKQKVYIIPTVQNYLTRSVQRTLREIEIAKRKNLKFAAKLVRGAYLVQETKIADQNNVPNPIVDCFQKTTVNYLSSFQAIVKSFKNADQGEVIVATHNQDTIKETEEIYSRSNSNLRLSYAQLLGLADHLTWKVNNESKFTVYKYLPWAKTQVMIAYMIRRAEQLSQMRYPLDTQYYLLKHELKERFVG